MKYLPLTILLALGGQLATAQTDTATNAPQKRIVPFRKGTVMATVAVGFADRYRNDYSVPAGFEKRNTSGFAPVYAKAEYAFAKRWSIAGVFMYDDFQYNLFQQYNGFTGIIRRPVVNRFTLLAGGAQLCYHHPLAAIPKLDPFIAAGISINTIRESRFPQGDSTVERIVHSTAPSIRVGARYYLTQTFSFYGDAGYDGLSVFSLGMSVRFANKHAAQAAK